MIRMINDKLMLMEINDADEQWQCCWWSRWSMIVLNDGESLIVMIHDGEWWWPMIAMMFHDGNDAPWRQGWSMMIIHEASHGAVVEPRCRLTATCQWGGKEVLVAEMLQDIEVGEDWERRRGWGRWKEKEGMKETLEKKGELRYNLLGRRRTA